jgi:hypothetical protein
VPDLNIPAAQNPVTQQVSNLNTPAALTSITEQVPNLNTPAALTPATEQAPDLNTPAATIPISKQAQNLHFTILTDDRVREKAWRETYLDNPYPTSIEEERRVYAAYRRFVDSLDPNCTP